MADPILPSDLDAYIDDQLDVGRRIEVEAYLSGDPDAAARVMADLRVRGELRLALASIHIQGRPETREAARRLQGTLSNRRLFQTFHRFAAALFLVAIGWVANGHFKPFEPRQGIASVPVPVFVEEAVRAHGTAMLRTRMPSQYEAPDFDAAEVRSATGITMPELPADWQVTDVQIFPSAHGPSVEMAILRNGRQRLSLFAVRPGTFAVKPVSGADVADAGASYWQTGEVAYALVSDNASAIELKTQAEQLARSLH